MLNDNARKPQQNRSIASLDRMFNATMALMFERESEDFTLQEVSIQGKVSIGSIYHRFKSKDDLVREVLFRGLNQMADQEQEMITKLVQASMSLEEYVPQYIQKYTEILRDNSLVMRLAMRHASFDTEASAAGNNLMKKAKGISTAGLRHFSGDITGDIEIKINIVFDVIFATLARHLNLDTRDDLQLKQDLDKLIEELSVMSLSYLKNKAG